MHFPSFPRLDFAHPGLNLFLSFFFFFWGGGCVRYADAIREGSIDGAAFLGPEFDDLTAAIGLVSLGHKRILKQALEAFTTGTMEGPMSSTTAQEFEVTREGATSNDDACLDDSGDEAGSDDT